MPRRPGAGRPKGNGGTPGPVPAWDAPEKAVATKCGLCGSKIPVEDRSRHSNFCKFHRTLFYGPGKKYLERGI